MQRQTALLTAMIVFALGIYVVSGCEVTTSTSVCGNGTCESSETCSTCPADCGVCATCGDGTCQSTETCSSCPADCGACATCGDGTCQSTETCSSCPADCGACPTCGDGTCQSTETCSSCPADCGDCCGDGTCDSTETCETCPADCGACTTQATVSFAWYIHGVQGGVDVGWGSGTAQEVCELARDMSGLTVMPVVQLWLEETGDDIADTRVDFTCTAGSGTTEPLWEAGETLKYAFTLVDGAGEPISQSTAWETMVLSAGDNDLSEVNFYIGDYGPLGVEIQWANSITSPTYDNDCAFPDPDVHEMGYLLCWGSLTGDTCPAGNLYDEVDIDVDPITCRTDIRWDITDFGTYTLVIDGEDAAGTTLWGFECQDLIVDSEEPLSNEFICLVAMTVTP
jgi:hypothetical protein